MAGERVVLVDAMGLLFRAWHAVPANLSTAAGLPTNALFGFAQTMRRLFAGKRPAKGALVFDAPTGASGRKAELPSYKAHRPPIPDALRVQLGHLDALAGAHGFPILRARDAEADDVIATLTARALAEGDDVWVVSADKDLCQLVGERVRVFEPTAEVLLDAEKVRRKLGVPPERIPDWLALCGDDVDGIPGVRGVGARRAAELLERYGTAEAVVAAADAIGGRVGGALRAARDQVRLAKAVATLRADVDLRGPDGACPDLRLAPLDLAELDRAYAKLEFWSLLSPGASGAVPKQQGLRYFVVDDPRAVPVALANECAGPEPAALQVLLDEAGPGEVPALLGVALSPGLGRGLFFPAEVVPLLGPWLADPRRPKVAHDAKGALVALRRAGLELDGVVGDGALASYLVEPTRCLPHRIEQVAREVLHVGLQPVRGLLGSGPGRRRFSDLTLDKRGAWTCHLADAAGAVWRALEPRVRDEGRSGLLVGDLLLSRVLAGMELRGVGVDGDALAGLEAGLAAEREALEVTLADLAGRRFNPASHKQLGSVLFDDLGLPVRKRTRTGWSVDAEVLDALVDAHPIVPLVLRHRTVDKLIQGYTVPLRAAIRGGRVHATWQQTVGAAFRLVTTEPDLQRTPVRTDEFRALRAAFVAAPGKAFVCADYGQVELRILAHLSGDEALRAAFVEGRDVHRATASRLFGVPEEAVDRGQREVGKTVNFATLYGQGPAALARQLRIPVAAARAHVATFFASWPGVARWRDRLVGDALRDTFVTTIAGRRRYVPELFANDAEKRAYGERICLNTPVQGSAADLCKAAMLGADPLGDLVLQVHDELVLEVDEDRAEAVGAAVARVMAAAFPLSVPLEVSVGIGTTWDAAKDAA